MWFKDDHFFLLNKAHTPTIVTNEAEIHEEASK
jgi:hypothetical protein